MDTGTMQLQSSYNAEHTRKAHGMLPGKSPEISVEDSESLRMKEEEGGGGVQTARKCAQFLFVLFCI